jgi:(E)-4-hydroxy-3-methylbut-2-enyl-diphosphate synthase
VEDEFKGLNEEIHIAVMGCEVNGPGEARAADIGVAGGKGIGLIFRDGEVIRKVPEAEIVSAMREEVARFLEERRASAAPDGLWGSTGPTSSSARPVRRARRRATSSST